MNTKKNITLPIRRAHSYDDWAVRHVISNINKELLADASEKNIPTNGAREAIIALRSDLKKLLHSI